MNLSEIDLGNRADAEYYGKENLRIEDILNRQPHEKLGKLAKLTASAFYPAATHLYERGDMPFLRCVDVVRFPIVSHLQNEKFISVPTEFAETSKGINFLAKGDICLSKVGSPCFASVIHEHERIAMSRTVMGLSRIEGVDPYYLMVFLRCHHGFSQLQREREQTIQFQLTLDRVGSIQIFKPTPAFQQAIATAVLESFETNRKFQILQNQAEETLLAALDLKDWQPPNPLTYEAPASHAFTSERLDAEFFQSKYVAIEEELHSRYELKKLSQIATITKGKTVPYDEDGDIHVIRSGDLSDISDPFRFNKARRNDQMVFLKKGDILISSIGFGSIGKVQVFDLDVPCATVSEVTIIRNSEPNPYFLCAYLRSIAGQLQIERWITGATGQLHLYPRDVKSIFVPVIDSKIQEQFEGMAKEAAIAKSESHVLLERAKRAVEIAIEQDEAAAMDFLSKAE